MRIGRLKLRFPDTKFRTRILGGKFLIMEALHIHLTLEEPVYLNQEREELT